MYRGLLKTQYAKKLKKYLPFREGALKIIIMNIQFLQNISILLEHCVLPTEKSEVALLLLLAVK